MTKIYIHKGENADLDIPKYTSMSYDGFKNLENQTVESVYLMDILDYINIEDSKVFLMHTR